MTSVLGLGKEKGLPICRRFTTRPSGRRSRSRGIVTASLFFVDIVYCPASRAADLTVPSDVLGSGTIVSHRSIILSPADLLYLPFNVDVPAMTVRVRVWKRRAA